MLNNDFFNTNCTTEVHGSIIVIMLTRVLTFRQIKPTISLDNSLIPKQYNYTIQLYNTIIPIITAHYINCTNQVRHALEQ